jgi:hypothetical protein
MQYSWRCEQLLASLGVHDESGPNALAGPQVDDIAIAVAVTQVRHTASVIVSVIISVTRWWERGYTLVLSRLHACHTSARATSQFFT